MTSYTYLGSYPECPESLLFQPQIRDIGSWALTVLMGKISGPWYYASGLGRLFPADEADAIVELIADHAHLLCLISDMCRGVRYGISNTCDVPRGPRVQTSRIPESSLLD